MTTQQERGASVPAAGPADVDGRVPTAGDRLARYSREDLLDLYRQMRLIRTFEERTNEMYTRAKIGGYCHLNIGEEGSVVGICSALRPGDYMFTTYREHGYALSRGVAPGPVMAELFGRVDGTSKGRGGSMHLFDLERRFMGGYGIVGGNIALAVGAAFAADYQGADDVAVAIFGDGATNIGAFHESLNFAKIWNIPVVFICTNNQYGMGSSVSEVSAVAEIYRRAAAYDLPGEQVDGQDVLAVREVVSRAVERARGERLASLVEVMTYRYRGHSVADAGKVYRTQEEINRWRARDPLDLFREQLSGAGLADDETLRATDRQVEAEVNEAIAFADNSPDPALADLNKYIYSGDYPPIEGIRRDVR